MELVDNDSTDFRWVLPLLVGEAASDLKRLSAGHDAFDCAHDKCILPAAFVVLDNSSLGIVESLPKTSVIAVEEEEKILMTLTLSRALVRPFSYILRAHLSTRTQCSKPSEDSRLRSTQHQPLSTLILYIVEPFEHMFPVLRLRLVNNNDMWVLRGVRLAEGVPEVLHALLKRLFEGWNIENVVLDLAPAGGVGAADDGDRFLELATTSEELTVEPNISREA